MCTCVHLHYEFLLQTAWTATIGTWTQWYISHTVLNEGSDPLRFKKKVGEVGLIGSAADINTALSEVARVEKDTDTQHLLLLERGSLGAL